MATATEELLLRLDATAEGLRRELRKADDTVGDFARKTDRRMKEVDAAMDRVNRAGSLVTKGLAGLGVALSVGAITSFTKSNIAAADSLVKTADKLGLTVESLQELRFGAERSGVAVNQLDTGLQRFTRRLAEAQQGQGELIGTLKQYGIALRDSNGTARSAEAVLADYADAIQNAGSSQERLRLAFKAFDSEGAGMVGLLKNGAAGLEDLRQEARDAGVVLGGDLARRSEELNDRLGILSERADTAAQTFVLSMAPAIEAAIGVFERLSMAVADAVGGLGPQAFVFGDELDAARTQAEALRGELEALADVDGRSATRQGIALRARLGALEAVDAYAELARIQNEIAEQQEKIGAGGRARGKGVRDTAAQERIADLEKEAVAIQKVIDRAERGGKTAADAVATTSAKATAAINDNFTALDTQLAQSRKAYEALAGSGLAAFEKISAGFDLDEKAADAAKAFNSANKALIESGQLQSRTAADYRDTLGEIAELQERTADRQALDQYVAGLGEEYDLAKLRLQVGEEEAQVRTEIAKLRKAGVEISDTEEAAILKTAAATKKLADQWDVQTEAQKKAAKAAEDAAASFDDIPDEYADAFGALVMEALR